MPYQYGFITPGAGAGAQPPQMPASGADPLDAFISSQGGLAGGRSSRNTAATPPANAADPLDTFIASQGGLPKATAPAARAASPVLAQDLAAGGASPDTWSNLQQIGSGAWHGISSLASNAANLVEKGISAGVNAIPGVRGSAAGNWLANTANNDVSAQSAADQQFRQTASPGAQASAIVAPMLLPMGGALRVGNAIRDGITALPAMGGTVGRMVGTGIGNAATGAALSAGTAIDPNQPYWPQVGRNALVGAGMGVAAPAVVGGLLGAGRAAYNAAVPLLNPRGYVGQQFANAIGNDAAQVATNIRTAPVYVPGSMPTTAQVGATPFLAQTETAMANSNPAFKTALEQRAIDNNDARWQALMNVAQTPEALQAARTAREDATFPLYSTAGDQTANAGKALINLFQRPAMRQAAQQADQLAANRGETLVWPQQGGDMSINGRALDYTNRALGDMIGSAKASGNKELASGLADAQSQLQAWTSRYIPAQRQATQMYAQMSVPVNTMEVGQQIANGLGTRAMNAGQVPQIQLMPYRSALRQAMNGAPYGIDANAMNALQGIGQDLQRATVSNSIRAPGSDTAYNLTANGWLARQLYGRDFQGGMVGSVLGNAAQAAGAAGGAAMFGPAGAGVGAALGSGVGGLLNGSRVGTRLNEHLAGLLLNPHEFLPYLDARAVGAPAPVAGGLMQGLSGRLQYIPALAVPQLAGPRGNP
ncbi:hypothetical protein [Burkholderia seminalis]|uniref:hypothetical protein n=2 Tax=Burkholderia cepacia complex TaxID=87882 RepID=UPI001453D550|nr:hypothetical protein [Burkholderia seminalis]MCA8433854.1 hypothetical protein [Burkholderia seminalis]VWB52605.1 hypothetical protein BSE24067_02419 [Burkholderia seminalis]